MAPTNLIVNGTFDAGSTGFTGTDMETEFSEDAYLGNGSTNAVAEMDGTSGQTTVMEQSFTVTNPTSTELTFDSALRLSANDQAGLEGITVEILDDTGTVIATMTVLPTENVLTSFSLPVTFPEAGTYTVRLTEVGSDQGDGAIVDNISLLVCFAGATRIATPFGAKVAREISVGDMVETDRGPKTVKWVGHRTVNQQDIEFEKAFLPIKITAGALGKGLPKADLWISRQHRILVSSPVCQRLFKEAEVLVAAIRLTALPGIFIDKETKEIDYIHFLFDEHEVVYAEGAPCESLLLGAQARDSLSLAALDESRLIFPDWEGE